MCVIDDARWLDPESAVVLGLAARRLYAKRVVLLFAVRDLVGLQRWLPGAQLQGGVDRCVQASRRRWTGIRRNSHSKTRLMPVQPDAASAVAVRPLREAKPCCMRLTIDSN